MPFLRGEKSSLQDVMKKQRKHNHPGRTLYLVPSILPVPSNTPCSLMRRACFQIPDKPSSPPPTQNIKEAMATKDLSDSMEGK